MKKQIIINDIDISECKFKRFIDWTFIPIWECSISYNKNKLGDIIYDKCASCPNCYFKNWVRMKKRNEYLRNILEKIKISGNKDEILELIKEAL